MLPARNGASTRLVGLVDLAKSVVSRAGVLVVNVGNGELKAQISNALWSLIRHTGLDHAVLVAAESGGLDGVNHLVGRVAVRNSDRTPRKSEVRWIVC